MLGGSGMSPYSLPRGNARSFSLPLEDGAGDRCIVPKSYLALELEVEETFLRVATPYPDLDMHTFPNMEFGNLDSQLLPHSRRHRSASSVCSLPPIFELDEDEASDLPVASAGHGTASISSSSISIILPSASMDTNTHLLHQDLSALSTTLPSADSLSLGPFTTVSYPAYTGIQTDAIPFTPLPLSVSTPPPPSYTFDNDTSSDGDDSLLTPTSSPFLHRSRSPGRAHTLGLGLGLGLTNFYKDSGETFDGIGILTKTPFRPKSRRLSHLSSCRTRSSSESSDDSATSGSSSSADADASISSGSSGCSSSVPPTRIFLEQILATFNDPHCASESLFDAELDPFADRNAATMPLTPSNSSTRFASPSRSQLSTGNINTPPSPIAMNGTGRRVLNRASTSVSAARKQGNLKRVASTCSLSEMSISSERRDVRKPTVASLARANSVRSARSCAGRDDGVVKPTWRY